MNDYNNMSFTLGRSYSFDNMSSSEDQFGDDLAQLTWNSSNVDPSLEKIPFHDSSLSHSIMPFPIQQQIFQRNFQESRQHPRIQNPTMQRFVEEPQRQFFTAPSLPQELLRGGMLHASLPTSSLPRPSHHRVDSPSLSHGFTSMSESVDSPEAEPEYYPYSSYSVMDNQHFTQPTSNIQGGPVYQPYALPPYPGSSCVTMHEIQGFADAGDTYYDNRDEGFEEATIKDEFTMDVGQDRNHNEVGIHTTIEVQAYRYPSDEGIGYSVRDEASPKHDSFFDEGHMSEVDADGGMDDIEDEHIPATPVSDAEYIPRSTRARKRRASPASKSIAPSAKRSKILKAPLKTNGQTTCKSCNHAPFKDAATLQRHIVSTHTRAYICVFEFAGCAATFASKNEWKRHVSSQHMNLEAWVCEQGACGSSHTRSNHSTNSSNGNTPRGIEFNRKDLFTQHLRRMHVPTPIKRKKAGSDADWEDTIRGLQQTCLRTKRQAPTRLNCAVRNCQSHFEGTGCLDDRMEHVGKHLEEQAQGKLAFSQGDDVLLVQWALKEGIVELKAAGVFRLAFGGAGSGRRAVKTQRKDVNMDHEEDAECEDDE